LAKRNGGGKAAYVEEEAVPRVALDDLTPAKFFDEFVAQRRPCILQGKLPGAAFDKVEILKMIFCGELFSTSTWDTDF
jgi:hypothetical protein